MQPQATSLKFVIRDGLVSDIEACLRLDHAYQTEYVWQMNVQKGAARHQITFRPERLPHPIETNYPNSQPRLEYATQKEHCFLVAAERETQEILGYLTMRNDPIYHMGWIQDLLVTRVYRNNGIGTRLLNVAKRWAREHRLRIIMIEIQTKNFPGIQFCQSQGFVISGFNDLYFENHDIALFFGREI